AANGSSRERIRNMGFSSRRSGNLFASLRTGCQAYWKRTPRFSGEESVRRLAQLFEQQVIGVSVRGKSRDGLEGARGGTRLPADNAVRLAALVTERVEQSLDLGNLRRRQQADVIGTLGGETAHACNAVREIADRERVALRGIPFHDDVEVVIDEERRSLVTH